MARGKKAINDRKSLSKGKKPESVRPLTVYLHK